ncbi:hypothetical protein [Saccharothrix sp. HUAS TT1]|uniref:hypothetical protein n=1 Tax=unclassified Saccharothrix TaxID=2593673 RepID=UPI00345BCA41
MADSGVGRRGGRPWRALPDGQPELNALITWLRDRLDHHGRTLRDLTTPMNRGKDTIARALSGDRRPDWEFVVALLRACVPHDPRASDRLVAMAEPLWNAAGIGTAPLPVNRSAVESLRAEVRAAETRCLRARSAVHVHRTIVDRLLWLLSGLITSIDTLAEQRAELNARIAVEQADRRAAQEALGTALELNVRLAEARHRLPQAEQQLDRAHAQLARANRIHQDAIGDHLHLRQRLLELGGATTTDRAASFELAAHNDHELMGSLDQVVADAVLTASRQALDGAAAELDDLAGPPRVPGGAHLADPLPDARLLAALSGGDRAPQQCVLRVVDALVHEMPSHGGHDRTTIDIVLRRGTGEAIEAVVVRARGRRLTSVGLPLLAAAYPLGRKITVGAVTDGRWTEFELDLGELGAGRRPTSRRRTSGAEPPTDVEVVITDVHADAWHVLRRPRMIAEHIADVYSHALRQGDLRVTVDGDPVAPRLPCAWREDRTVLRQDQVIAAVQHVDFVLPPDFPGTLARERPRRVHGWLGIQRYLHEVDYGIDFLWRGRKILVRDKRLFTWNDPHHVEPQLREYPVDLPNQGRIIGEIHCDDFDVNFQKNDFEITDDTRGRLAAGIRGTGPILPMAARTRGYPENTSPLGLLVHGFRRSSPGLRWLMPGDGQSSLHELSRQWAERFRAGDPAFQDDRIWYEAARDHELLARPGTTATVVHPSG